MRTRLPLGIVIVALFLVRSAWAADHSVEPIVSRIPREPVESQAVAAVGYSRKLRALEIEFRDGLIYRYTDVPPVLHHALLAADSKARFYNQKIRGRYHCLRVKSHRPR